MEKKTCAVDLSITSTTETSSLSILNLEMLLNDIVAMLVHKVLDLGVRFHIKGEKGD